MNKKFLVKLISVLICLTVSVAIAVTPISVGAATVSELKQKMAEAQKRVNDAKAKQASQKQLQAEIENQINVIQDYIDECNAQIAKYSSQISAKQKEIDEKNAKIEADKAQFKRRIRAIYMSNTESGVQVLLGADSFSDYLTLAQMTKSVSAHDKALIERIIDAVKKVESEKSEIQEMLNAQNELKSEKAAQKSVYDARNAELQSELSKLSHDIAADTALMQKTSDEIDKQSAASYGGGAIYYSGDLKWPSNFTYISAGFNSGDSVHRGNHKGIDIAGSGISGSPVYAAASGTVYASNGSCPHNYGKSYSCGCGGGYGNYVAIDHGRNSSGSSMKTLYGHMKSICVSNGQHVEKGQVIGYVGTTGWSTGPHLHFETIYNGVKVNPMQFFKKS